VKPDHDVYTMEFQHNKWNCVWIYTYLVQEILKGYSTFFGNRLILQLNSWVLPFSDVFRRFSDI